MARMITMARPPDARRRPGADDPGRPCCQCRNSNSSARSDVRSRLQRTARHRQQPVVRGARVRPAATGAEAVAPVWLKRSVSRRAAVSADLTRVIVLAAALARWA